MINEAKQDLATQYVLGQLEPEEEARLRAMLSGDPELQRFISELREAAAKMALATPPQTPPPELIRRILDQVRKDAE
ncbi:MAG: hypothetical protein PHC88_03975 [Terrimicrobiaceae bacterium]|nr:hypothetical protein [Terrimicrobiaceae bacterium]